MPGAMRPLLSGVATSRAAPGRRSGGGSARLVAERWRTTRVQAVIVATDELLDVLQGRGGGPSPASVIPVM